MAEIQRVDKLEVLNKVEKFGKKFAIVFFVIASIFNVFLVIYLTNNTVDLYYEYQDSADARFLQQSMSPIDWVSIDTIKTDIPNWYYTENLSNLRGVNYVSFDFEDLTKLSYEGVHLVSQARNSDDFSVFSTVDLKFSLVNTHLVSHVKFDQSRAVALTHEGIYIPVDTKISIVKLLTIDLLALIPVSFIIAAIVAALSYPFFLRSAKNALN